jgi:hypothetical protein
LGNLTDNYELIQQRMANSKLIAEEAEENAPEEPKEGILSESDLGSELDDELFKIDDTRN